TPPAPEAPPGGALHVRVRGPRGLVLTGVEVSAVLRGDENDEGTTLEESEDEDGVFGVDELEVGRYDVLVEAPGMRPARLDDVPTGQDVVAVSLARAGVLLGAVGRRDHDGRCEGVHVTA